LNQFNKIYVKLIQENNAGSLYAHQNTDWRNSSVTAVERLDNC